MQSPRANTKKSGSTLTELLITMCLMGIFGATLLSTWNALGGSFTNTTAYAQRQSDQMRVCDYLKRDIRRATAIQIFSGGVPVTGNNFGTEMWLTIPDYYADTREEDNVFGSRIPNTPTLSSGTPTYGGSITIKYYVLNGAVIREESGVGRTVADSTGAFTVSFANDPSGLIRCRVLFNQLLRSGTGRVLLRQVDILCGQRSQLQS